MFVSGANSVGVPGSKIKTRLLRQTGITETRLWKLSRTRDWCHCERSDKRDDGRSDEQNGDPNQGLPVPLEPDGKHDVSQVLIKE